MTSRTKELPELVREAVDLSRDYLRQETIEPAKRLGRVAGFSFGGALAFLLAALFLGIAGLRFLVDLLPEGTAWSGLGYVLWSLVLIGTGGLVIVIGRRPG